MWTIQSTLVCLSIILTINVDFRNDSKQKGRILNSVFLTVTAATVVVT